MIFLKRLEYGMNILLLSLLPYYVHRVCVFVCKRGSSGNYCARCIRHGRWYQYFLLLYIVG